LHIRTTGGWYAHGRAPKAAKRHDGLKVAVSRWSKGSWDRVAHLRRGMEKGRIDRVATRVRSTLVGRIAAMGFLRTKREGN
jgi:hypothetical protein